MDQGDKSRILTAALCRGARGLLGWSQLDLAERAAVSRSTVKDFESGARPLHRVTEAQVMQAITAGGVVVDEVNGLGVGLFLRRAD